MAASAGIVLCAPGPASAQTYPPVDTPGPALSVSQSQLDAALVCSADLTGVSPEPVLLVPGTTLTPQQNFSWNWIPALNALNWDWCTVELPGSAMADIQIAGEYVVNAIRAMSADYGGQIDVLGFSQGGMVPRWALRFWPDTRPLVDDLVGIAPSNHGTTTTGMLCAAVGCAPALWQQNSPSEFLKALNSHQETFAGIDYTVVYTTLDDVVQPNANDTTGSSPLRPGDTASISNVAVQDVCTGMGVPYTNHLLVGTVSNPAYLLAKDALESAGPADPAGIDFSSACGLFPMPGVNITTGSADAAAMQSTSINTLNTYPKTAAEPAVACYAVSPCGPVGGGGSPTGGGGGGGGGSTAPASTGKRAAAVKKCKKKKGRARAKCLKKAKKLPA